MWRWISVSVERLLVLSRSHSFYILRLRCTGDLNLFCNSLNDEKRWKGFFWLWVKPGNNKVDGAESRCEKLPLPTVWLKNELGSLYLTVSTANGCSAVYKSKDEKMSALSIIVRQDSEEKLEKQALLTHRLPPIPIPQKKWDLLDLSIIIWSLIDQFTSIYLTIIYFQKKWIFASIISSLIFLLSAWGRAIATVKYDFSLPKDSNLFSSIFKKENKESHKRKES